MIIEAHSVMRNIIQIIEPGGGVLVPCLRLYRAFYMSKFDLKYL